jgi:hypothetical protein
LVTRRSSFAADPDNPIFRVITDELILVMLALGIALTTAAVVLVRRNREDL